jgi:hypothetical protein
MRVFLGDIVPELTNGIGTFIKNEKNYNDHGGIYKKGSFYKT